MTTEHRKEVRQATKVAFDVDCTLIDRLSRPVLPVINVLDWFVRGGFDVIVWSGCGVDYAEMWARKLGFDGLVRCIDKGSENVDLTFDDMVITLGKANICVSDVGGK